MSAERRGGTGFLRPTARIATVVGAAGSLVLMLLGGGHWNEIRLLLALFTGWVLLPFAGLMTADRASSGWSEAARTALYSVMLIVSFASLAIYGVVTATAAAKPAAMFLMVPLGSWLLIAIAVIVGRRSRGSTA